MVLAARRDLHELRLEALATAGSSRRWPPGCISNVIRNFARTPRHDCIPPAA
jgi:hypothetical protein